MRLFVAYAGASEWESIQQQARTFNPSPEIRWTHSYNLHLTLYFIGEADPALLPGLVSGFKSVFLESNPFELIPMGVMPMPTATSPKMIWFRYRQNEDFSMLNRRLYDTVHRLIPSATTFPDPLPHVTLARMKSGKVKWADVTLKTLPEPLAVSSAALWQTTHDENGIRYKELARFDFGKNQSASATTS